MENGESACKTTQQQIELKQELFNQQQNKVAELKQNVNRLMASKLQLSHDLQQRSSLVEKQKALELSVDQSRNDLEDWKFKLQPLVTKQEQAKAVHAEAQIKRHAVLEHARAKVRKCSYS